MWRLASPRRGWCDRPRCRCRSRGLLSSFPCLQYALCICVCLCKPRRKLGPMFTLAFWRATLERVISSIAGGALSVLGADVFGVFDVDFKGVASVALGAGLVSLLKALVVGKATDGGP